jgi:hypothetical protein
MSSMLVTLISIPLFHASGSTSTAVPLTLMTPTTLMWMSRRPNVIRAYVLGGLFVVGWVGDVSFDGDGLAWGGGGGGVVGPVD